MHYNFLFSGCSWTFGSELEGISDDQEHRRKHRYSHLIAKKYNKTYDNIAEGGSSNDRIIRKTIEWFEQGNTCDIAIIQFTLVCRIEYITEIEKEQIYEAFICGYMSSQNHTGKHPVTYYNETYGGNK